MTASSLRSLKEGVAFLNEAAKDLGRRDFLLGGESCELQLFTFAEKDDGAMGGSFREGWRRWPWTQVSIHVRCYVHKD